MTEKDNNNGENESELVAEVAAPPEPLFQRYDFNAMPGVALIVPDGTPPADLIRIAGKVGTEIGLMVMHRAVNAVLGM